jgi:hypothetical protein
MAGKDAPSLTSAHICVSVRDAGIWFPTEDALSNSGFVEETQGGPGGNPGRG